MPSVIEYGMTGHRSQDATELLKSMMASLPAGSTIEIPAGAEISIGNPQVTLAGTAVRVTKPFHWRGPGTIFIPDPGYDWPAGRSTSYTVLSLEENAAGSTFADLLFKGTNDPFGGINNFIIQTAAAVWSGVDNVTFDRCRFHHLWGHTIKDFGRKFIHVRDCEFYECTNGLNVNASHSHQLRNRFIRVNGQESAGDYNRMEDGYFFQSAGTSIGGKGGPAKLLDTIVRRNVYVDIWKGAAITIAAGAGCIIEYNDISGGSWGHPGEHGIQSQDSTALNVPGWEPGYAGRNFYRFNKIRMHTGGGAGHAMFIQAGPGSVLEGNDAFDPQFAAFGLVLNADRCLLLNNKFAGGIRDVHMAPTSGSPPITVYMKGNTAGSISQPSPDGSQVTIVNELPVEISGMAKIALAVNFSPPPAVHLWLEETFGIHDDNPVEIRARIVMCANGANNRSPLAEKTVVIKDGISGQPGTESIGITRGVGYEGITEKRVIVPGAMTDAITAWYNAGNGSNLTKAQRLEARKQALLTHLLSVGLIDSSLTGNVT